MQVQRKHPHQWAPLQVAGLLHAWQISHQISRYVYHEGRQPRDSTLCQLLPCHLGPPRPTLFISLCVEGCLDRTFEAFHIKPSPLQNEVQILNAKPRKKLIGSGGDNVLQLDIADLSDHYPVILLQTLEVWLCQWPSLTGMEHCTPQTRAVHAVTCLKREVTRRENW